MKKSLLSLAIISTLSLTGFSGVAQAETPSFNTVQLSSTELSFDDSFDMDGYEFKWNYELNKDFYVNADYTKVDKMGIDLKMKNLGLGYQSAISNSSALFAQLDWSNFSSNLGSDDDGYRVTLGIRSNVTDKLELKAAYEYVDVDGSSNLFDVGGAYKLTDNLAFTVDYKKESDFDQTSFGVRYDF